MKIYTDGACSQNGTWNGGWGVVVVENGSHYSLGGNEKKTTKIHV